MKLYVKLIVVFILPSIGYAQIDCPKLSEGTFKIETGYGNILVEKSKNFQLESSKDFNSTYLEKIESISECEYILKRYKIIAIGDLPAPNMSEMIKIQVYKIEGDSFFYHSQLMGTELIMDGVLLKTSNDISNEFKEILAKEK